MTTDPPQQPMHLRAQQAAAKVLAQMPPFRPGEVWLAGCGSAHLREITIELISALAQADVIIHDSLIPAGFQALIASSCKVIHLGKRGGMRSGHQGVISQQLIKYARQNYRVLRLKGGDPTIFSRLADEITALNHAKISFRVLPGLSSFQSAAARLGIPLTHRELSQTLMLCTGQDQQNVSPAHIEWKSIVMAKSTVVLFMASNKLCDIARQLLAHGAPGDLPLVAISKLGHLEETLTFATLGSLKSAQLATPVIVIIGEVVKLAQGYQKFANSSVSRAVYTKQKAHEG